MLDINRIFRIFYFKKIFFFLSKNPIIIETVTLFEISVYKKYTYFQVQQIHYFLFMHIQFILANKMILWLFMNDIHYAYMYRF